MTKGRNRRVRTNSGWLLELLYYDWVLSLNPAALDRVWAYVDAKRLEGRVALSPAVRPPS
ncbi:MAG: hypothetical protein SXV54_26405 [Chloroflexota bacterium]|nr:hypothetical protein [Chloroflexota bacterium]